MQEMQTRQRLLTAHQLQRLLHVDASTIYRMAADGRLPAIKVGRQWRFPADEIESRFGTIPTLAAPTAAPAPDAEVLQGVIDFAASTLGVMMVVTDMNGHPKTEVANPCRRFAENAADPEFVAECAAEWAGMADDPDLLPRFVTGSTGFACARSFMRSGNQLTGMVLAGGLACDDDTAADLHQLTREERRKVLAALPRLAALLSRMSPQISNEQPRSAS